MKNAARQPCVTVGLPVGSGLYWMGIVPAGGDEMPEAPTRAIRMGRHMIDPSSP
jgi:hypothetical protein